MSDKGFRGSKSTPVKDWVAALGVTALLAASGAGLGFLLNDVPSPTQTAITQGQQFNTVVTDPSDRLSEDDERRLLEDASRLDTPSTVHTLHYLVLTENRDNVNDSVENYLRDHFPEEIGEEYFADGVIIIGTDVESRNNFIFAGQDVLDQLYLHPGQRLEGALDAMKPGLRDNNIPAGLFAGANTAMDIEAAQQYPINDAEGDRTASMIGLGVLGGGVGLAGGAGVAVGRGKRRQAIAQARDNHAVIASEYTGLSQRLDELDIRANSVSSAFANRELREQWDEVRSRFLSMHDAMRLEVGTDRQAWENRKELERAAETVTDTGHAEDNINRLFRVEQGDAAERRSIIADIRGDVQSARRKVKKKTFKHELEMLEDRLDYMLANPTSPDFLDEFVILLRDYTGLLDDIKAAEFSDVKEYNALERPSITSPDFVYVNYVPYVTMNSWHSSNVQAHEAAKSSSSSSSGTNTSFSSGFSGGGGSSSY